jgi:hypothetical protein
VARKRLLIREDPLQNWKLLDRFRTVLRRLPRRTTATAPEDPRRQLLEEDYFCSYLFAMLNPAITSMRAFCHASTGRKMRQVCSHPVSPASFSEGQHVFSPQVLEQVVRQMARQALGLEAGGDERVRQALKTLTAVDGTVLRAVPRMVWAPASGAGCAVRLHLHFSVFDQVPERWEVTPGKVCERKVLAKMAQAGSMLVGDRHYSNDYQLLERLCEQGVDFVFRLHNNAILTPVTRKNRRTQKDLAAGVVWDGWMQLGVHGQGPVLRVVRVEANGEVFHLVTNRADLSAELISLVYRQRWQIELFFKWIKTILNCRHWLAESPRGAAIQIYCVLIAALLLMLWTGRRPNKRAVESLRLYWMGWATEDELVLLLQKSYPSKKS